MQNTQTREILKIGSTCSQKLLGSNSDLTIEQLEEKRTEIANLKENLMEIIKDTGVSQIELKKHFTDQEKEKLINDALKENILTSELKILLTNGIPLSTSQYLQLEKNIKKLKNEKSSLSVNYNSNNTESITSLLPGNPISLILQGTGLTEINGSTDIKDYEMIVISLIDYMKSTAVKDKRKTINYIEIFKSIESNFHLLPSKKERINATIFELSLRYLNNQKNSYKLLKCDFSNQNFIYTYL